MSVLRFHTFSPLTDEKRQLLICIFVMDIIILKWHFETLNINIYNYLKKARLKYDMIIKETPQRI